jgi:CubicO group peptidase (beta-lactamase class C family)
MADLKDIRDAPIAEFVPELDRLAVDVMADWKVPGAAVAVVQDGKVTLAKAYGRRDVEANLPVTTATQFLICSITKSFTATAVALLHNEGRLDWNMPVRDYMPEFRLSDAVATERVTVRDLLCHQTGLPRHDWVHFAGDRAPAEMLGVMRHLELSRDIRAAWQYNNLCYNAVGLLIERISGQGYEAFTRLRLTDRLGMNVSFTLDDLEASLDSARPYMMHEDTRLPAMRLPIRTVAAGAINTSVRDIANWMLLHLGKGEFEGGRLLPAALIGELHAPRVYNTSPSYAEFGEAHYGLGFQSNSYRGDRVVFHGGGWPGWGTLMTLVYAQKAAAGPAEACPGSRLQRAGGTGLTALTGLRWARPFGFHAIMAWCKGGASEARERSRRRPGWVPSADRPRYYTAWPQAKQHRCHEKVSSQKHTERLPVGTKIAPAALTPTHPADAITRDRR